MRIHRRSLAVLRVMKAKVLPINSVKQAHGEVPYWETPLLRGDKVQCELRLLSPRRAKA